MQLDYEDIVHFGEQLLALECMYKQYADNDLQDYLWWVSGKSVTLKDSVLCQFWNRGYPIDVDEVKLRSDGCVIVCGINLYNNKRDEEFFSYIKSYRDMKEIVEQILIY